MNDCVTIVNIQCNEILYHFSYGWVEFDWYCKAYYWKSNTEMFIVLLVLGQSEPELEISFTWFQGMKTMSK